MGIEIGIKPINTKQIKTSGETDDSFGRKGNRMSVQNEQRNDITHYAYITYWKSV